MTLAINSVGHQKAAQPSFREKDAVCIEARASKTSITIKPVRPPLFPYLLADMQIAAQLSRQQVIAPTANAHKAAFSYQRHNVAARSGGFETRV